MPPGADLNIDLDINAWETQGAIPTARKETCEAWEAQAEKQPQQKGKQGMLKMNAPGPYVPSSSRPLIFLQFETSAPRLHSTSNTVPPPPRGLNTLGPRQNARSVNNYYNSSNVEALHH